MGETWRGRWTRRGVRSRVSQVGKIHRGYRKIVIGQMALLSIEKISSVYLGTKKKGKKRIAKYGAI